MKQWALAFIYLVSAYLMPGICLAQTPAAGKAHRILILLNGSASMGGNWKADSSKYQAATRFITQLAERMLQRNYTIEFGLRTYGSMYNATVNHCNDSRREVPFTRDNRTQLALRLENLHPKGKGSFSYALAQALEKDITDTATYQYSVIVLSDDMTYCNADYCFAASGIQKALYRSYFIDLSGTVSISCYDKVFQVINNHSLEKALEDILYAYPVLKQPYYNWDAASTSQKPIDTVKPVSHTIKEQSKPAASSTEKIARADTVNEGYANITNTNQIYTTILYIKEKGKYKKLEEIYFFGRSTIKFPLKPGKYKVAYHVGNKEIASEFSIIKGETTDVRIN